MKRIDVLIISAMLLVPCLAIAQEKDKGKKAPADRSELRSGNRDFKKSRYKEAEIDYRKAILKDSTSVPGNYNLANTLYMLEDYQSAGQYIDAADVTPDKDVYFNKGNIALKNKDYGAAVEAFKKSLLLNPSDIDAKESYIYAKLMQENQQNQQNQDQNQQDQNQNQDQNQDQNKDQNQDQNQDQNKDQNQDQNKDNQDQNQKQQPQQQPELSPQAAEQMLQAIEAKEKETQDKVKKEEALRANSRQKEKNW